VFNEGVPRGGQLGRECPEAVSPDRALYLKTFSHLLIVNKLLSLYTRHLILYPIHCSTSYTVDPKPQAIDPTPLALQSIPQPCTLKPNFKAPPPLRHCPSTSCSFSPFASLASSEHSGSSPYSRSSPPPAPPPVPPLDLCLFGSSPATSCSTTWATTTKTCCPPPEPPAIMRSDRWSFFSFFASQSLQTEKTFKKKIRRSKRQDIFSLFHLLHKLHQPPTPHPPIHPHLAHTGV
jgi:hypothetical protein